MQEVGSFDVNMSVNANDELVDLIPNFGRHVEEAKMVHDTDCTHKN